MNGQKPIFTLALESFQTNPPRPISFGVLEDRRVVGFITLEEFDSAREKLREAREAAKVARAALSDPKEEDRGK